MENRLESRGHPRTWPAFVTKRREPAVYFVLSDDGPVKIGFSKDVLARLKTLQANSAFKLTLLAMVPGPRVLEGEYHAYFAEYRLRGEWYEPADELIDFIWGLRTGSAAPPELLFPYLRIFKAAS